MYLKSKISSYYILIIPWALIFICLLLLKRSAELFTIIFLLDVWLLSHPHAISTFTKKRVRKNISFFKIIMAVFFIGITLATVSVKLSFVVVFNIYFFLQWFHYARQNYGITIKQKKSNLNRKVSFFIQYLLFLSFIC